MIEIPADFPVKALGPNDPILPGDIRATCGTCGRSWIDSEITSITPAPAGRCPFEGFHPDEPEPYDWRTDVRALLDYSWSAEQRDYLDNPGDRHIFLVMRRLDRFLTGDMDPVALARVPLDQNGMPLAWRSPTVPGGWVDAWNGDYSSRAELLAEIPHWTADESNRVLSYGQNVRT